MIMFRKRSFPLPEGNDAARKPWTSGEDPRTVLAERHGVCGLTMIEVLIASTVLTIGLLGMVAMQGRTMRGIGYGRHVSSVTTLMEAKAEEMHLLDWTHPDLVAGTHIDSQNPLTETGSVLNQEEEEDPYDEGGVEYPDYPEEEPPDPNAIFNRSWVVTDVDEDGNGSIDRKDVDLTLSWRRAGDHAVTVTTSIARH